MPHLPRATPRDLGLDEGALESAYDRLDEWTSGQNPPIPGGVILAGRNGQTLAPRFFGRMGPEPNAPKFRPDAIFRWLRSPSPWFTWGRCNWSSGAFST